MLYTSVFITVLTLGTSYARSVSQNVGLDTPRDPASTNNVVLAHDVDGRNMVTVPPSCPPGQEFINGVCRDVWRSPANMDNRNMITVPPSCPPGQALVNGVCRDIWRYSASTQRSNIEPQNVVTVPTNCPPGQEFINGVCRDIWRKFTVTEQSNIETKDAVNVPTRCLRGQQLIHGVCGDMRIKNSTANAVAFEAFLKKITEHLTIFHSQAKENGEVENKRRNSVVIKNIVDIPSQCPVGYRPDANGRCRQIM